MKGEKEEEKIVLPKALQLEMLKFFLRTSIPRYIKNTRQDNSSLSIKDNGGINEKEQ